MSLCCLRSLPAAAAAAAAVRAALGYAAICRTPHPKLPAGNTAFAKEYSLHAADNCITASLARDAKVTNMLGTLLW